MPTNRKRRPREIKKLDWEERLDLMLSRSWAPDSPFPSPEARKMAWELHRSRLLHPDSCVRPACWWNYEALGQLLIIGKASHVMNGRTYEYDIEETQLAALVRLGQASPKEIELFKKWHDQQFSRPEEELTNLFKWHPDFEVQYKHERRILSGLTIAR